MNRPQYLAKAFLSCSLREEDKDFINLVERILHYFQILPFGTVGRHSASTDNPVSLMKKNIQDADFVVIAATKRYLTTDSCNGVESNTLSEMIHTEAGMAFSSSKPIVVFVEKGTNVGNFIPEVTQYITLDGTNEDVNRQFNLIRTLLNDAYQKALETKNKKSQQEIGKLLLKGFAFYGISKLLINNDSEYCECEE